MTASAPPTTSCPPPAFRSSGKTLSAPFIVGDDYGTRCSTVFALDHDRTVEFVERSFAPDGTATGDVRLRFRLQQR